MKLIDITGQRFGDLTALHYVKVETTASRTGGAMWRCRCDCGKENVWAYRDLAKGTAKSCGHKYNLTGRTFGKLTVIGRARMPQEEKNSYWKCRCECGETSITRGTNLKTGRTKSCGCMMRFFNAAWNGHMRKPWSKRSRYYDPNAVAP